MSDQPAFHQSHPHSNLLRQRAAILRELSVTIERSLVMTLGDAAEESPWSTRRARMCQDMLERNVQQLHQAADDLLETALGLRQRADDLDLAQRAADSAA